MTDNVQQIRQVVEKCYNKALERSKIIDGEHWKIKADAYRTVLSIIDYLVEENENHLNKENRRNKIMRKTLLKALQFLCGFFGMHKWATYTKGQMCKRCGKKRFEDKWYYEIDKKDKMI